MAAGQEEILAERENGAKLQVQSAICHRSESKHSVLTQRMMLRYARYWHGVWSYNMRGTDAAYGAATCAVLTQHMARTERAGRQSSRVEEGRKGTMHCAMSGTDLAYDASRYVSCPVLTWRMLPRLYRLATSSPVLTSRMPPHYVMSGTDLAYAAARR
eukprot:3305905-Rhodomonas_salina.2